VNEHLLRILDEGFDKRAWHGPNLRGSLRGVDATKAARRPPNANHSIWELALHAAYWKYVIRRRLTGAKRGAFARVPSNFPKIPKPTAAAWKADIALLEEEHRLLRALVASTRFTAKQEFSIRGAALHDVYHAGQIRLLRKLLR
jgi:hypothetical protein